MSNAVRSVSAPPKALVIPKEVVEVEIRDLRGRVRAVQLFLAVDPSLEHRERLRDLFQARRFLPVKASIEGATDGKRRFELFSREHVVWVRQDLLTALNEIDLEAEASEESASALVRLELDDGSDLEGVVRYLLPSESRRVGDYFETLPDPFVLQTSDHVYLVRRGRVLSVVPLEEVRP